MLLKKYLPQHWFVYCDDYCFPALHFYNILCWRIASVGDTPDIVYHISVVPNRWSTGSLLPTTSLLSFLEKLFAYCYRKRRVYNIIVSPYFRVKMKVKRMITLLNAVVRPRETFKSTYVKGWRPRPIQAIPIHIGVRGSMLTCWQPLTRIYIVVAYVMASGSKPTDEKQVSCAR